MSVAIGDGHLHTDSQPASGSTEPKVLLFLSVRGFFTSNLYLALLRSVSFGMNVSSLGKAFFFFRAYNYGLGGDIAGWFGCSFLVRGAFFVWPA